MIEPAWIDLPLYRGTPFDDTIDFVGIDYTGATLLAQIRLYRGAAGDPLVELTGASPPAQGLSITTSTTDGVVTSHLRIKINETTIEGLPQQAPKDVKFAWDVHITGGGHIKTRRVQGDVPVYEGVIP